MNKIRSYLNGTVSQYGTDFKEKNTGELTDVPAFISLKWTGDSPIRIRVKREDTTENVLPIFEISGVLDAVDPTNSNPIYINNSSVTTDKFEDLGDPSGKYAREFVACLNPGVPFPDLTGRTDVTPIQCEGGENEIAFSMLDENPVPRTVFSVSIGQQQFVSGTIQDIYAYLGTVENLEMVLLSRDISPIDNGGSQNQ